ncbi:hypothetical protein, partial [Burkholderia pseudomallei]|uniref:hypothetical protein n=1 Tax=Burkholderia pseudomallei TaxID=28450 RepID=UPI001C4A82EE
MKVRSSIAIAAADHERTPRFILRRGEPLGTAERLAVTAARAAAAIPPLAIVAPFPIPASHHRAPAAAAPSRTRTAHAFAAAAAAAAAA